jgi:hypothetical protein
VRLCNSLERAPLPSGREGKTRIRRINASEPRWRPPTGRSAWPSHLPGSQTRKTDCLRGTVSEMQVEVFMAPRETRVGHRIRCPASTTCRRRSSSLLIAASFGVSTVDRARRGA